MGCWGGRGQRTALAASGRPRVGYPRCQSLPLLGRQTHVAAWRHERSFRTQRCSTQRWSECHASPPPPPPNTLARELRARAYSYLHCILEYRLPLACSGSCHGPQQATAIHSVGGGGHLDGYGNAYGGCHEVFTNICSITGMSRHKTTSSRPGRPGFALHPRIEPRALRHARGTVPANNDKTECLLAASRIIVMSIVELLSKRSALEFWGILSLQDSLLLFPEK